jgi:hypothetical membrane protein
MRHRPNSRSRALASIGVIGPIGYVALVTALGILWEGYDPIRDTQSELGASDSPYGPVMNVAGFVGLGVSILAFAAAYWSVIHRSTWKALAVAASIVAGVGMIAVGFFPCDPGCVDVTATGRLHSTFSMPVAIAVPVAAMLSAGAFRIDGRFGIGWQVSSFWLGLLSLASGPIIAAAAVEDVNGLLQRAAMWIALGWVVAVSSKLRSLSRA